MEKKEMWQLIQRFLEETEPMRTEYEEEHDIPSERPATFTDFIYWLGSDFPHNQ